MKVLLITDEVWNDNIHGNNVLTNWFKGFPASFAHVYCSPGSPNNESCSIYYQITDAKMLESIYKPTYAGGRVEITGVNTTEYYSTDIKWALALKAHFGNVLRLAKNIVWTIGRIDEVGLRGFVSGFNPDLVFCPRLATPKLLRLERLVHQYTSAPFVAFTGDTEYSLRMFSFSPVAWINKFWTRCELKRNTRFYAKYYTLSDEQKIEYQRVFKCPIEILRKGYDVKKEFNVLPVHSPIKIVYAGKLYCNRWKTLSAIGRAIMRINQFNQKMILEIYTKDKVTRRQRKALDIPGCVKLCGAISSSDVLKKYAENDIVLHVESLDFRNRLATRLSFSTKIVDCLASGTAVMAVAWKEHSGLTYLRREDAAFCIDNYSDIYQKLKLIADNPEIINKYKENARLCLERNHNRDVIQRCLYSQWEKIIINQ